MVRAALFSDIAKRHHVRAQRWLGHRFFQLGRKKPARTVFQGFWHGPPLGPLRQACLSSFVQMGHQYELYVYESVRVPEGVLLRDASEIIPLSELFYFDNPINGKPDIGPFSDLFRFKLLSERGGWWSDVDAICVSAEIPPVERAWAQELPERRPNAIGTSQIAFSAGDPIVSELYRRCLNLSKSKFPSRESLGPNLISDTIRELGLPLNSFGTSESFYPIRWVEMFKLWLPQFRDEIVARSERAYFLPVYASFPQYIGLNLGRLPPEGSFLSDICAKYWKDHKSLQPYTAADVEAGTRRFLVQQIDWAFEELWSVAGTDALQSLGLGSELACFTNLPPKLRVVSPAKS